MGAKELKKRTQTFGLSVIKLIQTLPDCGPVNTISRQLMRCGTSVGANFRSACRARSDADFIAKLKIVEEECDESICWLELLASIHSRSAPSVRILMDEANQILSIIVASIKTARRKS